MDVIHKEVLEIANYQALELKGFQKILSFGVQDGKLCMWFLRDTSERAFTIVRIRIKGTGFTFESSELQGYTFGGTHQQQDGALIWHVFAGTNL